MRISRPRPASGRRPLVTVVVPCYNYGRYLPHAVKSITSQEGVDVEVIIVDDASTDGSQQVARDLAAADSRIRVILHEQNKRHIATYNDGLREAAGDYVVLLSADDLLAPGSLFRSSNLMEHHPEVGLVYGFAPDIADVPPAAVRARETWATWSGPEWIARMCARGTNIIVNPEAMLRGTVMKQLVGYDPDLPQSADMEIWMRAAALGGVGRVNGPVQAFYRVHDSNMHLTDFAGLLTDMGARRQAFEGFFARHGDQVLGASVLLEKARRTIAREAVRAAVSALRRDGQLGGAHAADFAQFALHTWPEISTTPIWQMIARQETRPASALSIRATAFADRVRGSLRWRVWRRYGI